MEYSIGELSKVIDMTIYGLRYYEKEGLVIPARKGQNRIYSEKDKLWLEFLIHMKDIGMSVHDMKKYTDLRKQDNPPLEELMQILINHRDDVEEQIKKKQENLRVLNKKINMYQQEIEDQEGKEIFDRFVENYYLKVN